MKHLRPLFLALVCLTAALFLVPAAAQAADYSGYLIQANVENRMYEPDNGQTVIAYPGETLSGTYLLYKHSTSDYNRLLKIGTSKYTLRFATEDASVAKVDAKTGAITAVATGSTQIKVYATLTGQAESANPVDYITVKVAKSFYYIQLVSADIFCDDLFYTTEEAKSGVKVSPKLMKFNKTANCWKEDTRDYTFKWEEWKVERDEEYGDEFTYVSGRKPVNFTVGTTTKNLYMKKTPVGTYRLTITPYVDGKKVSVNNNFWLSVDDPSTWTVRITNTDTWTTTTTITAGKKYYIEWKGSSAMYGDIETAILDPTTGEASTRVTDLGMMAGNNISPGSYVQADKVGKITFDCKLTRNGESTPAALYSKELKIVPKGISISSLTALTEGFKVTWKAQTSQTTGYQVQYSTSSTFSSSSTSTKTVTISNLETLTKSVTGLTAGKKYYVRLRTYKTIGSTKYYSAWSSKKYITTKS